MTARPHVRARRRPGARSGRAALNRTLYTSLQRHHRRASGGRLAIVVSTSRSRRRSCRRTSICRSPFGPDRVGHRAVPRGRSGSRPKSCSSGSSSTTGRAADSTESSSGRSSTLRTAWTSLLRGEVDMVTDVPPDAVEFIENDDSRCHLLRALVSVPRRVQFAPAPFDSPPVRRALNCHRPRGADRDRCSAGPRHAVDRSVLAEHWAYDTLDPAVHVSIRPSPCRCWTMPVFAADTRTAPEPPGRGFGLRV